MTGQLIELPEWLDRLGFEAGEYVQVGSKAPGAPFVAYTTLAGDVERDVPTDRDVWIGGNPVECVAVGRPSNDQVTRLAALHIDLDVKAGGCSSFDQARTIVDELAGMLGTRPVALTYSGHGLQPVWCIEDAYICDEAGHEPVELSRATARAMMRRWGRLVAAVAERYGAHVDALWDLTRILRCPGSVNHKDPANPVPVVTFGDTGAPITVERILETLDEYGIVELPEDAKGLGDVVAPPSEWAYAPATCGYAATMMSQWATDQPTERHGWLLQNAPRVAAAVRYGCLDDAGHRLAVATLSERFVALLAQSPARNPTPGEVSGALAWGMERAACMSEHHLASELGYHLHAAPIPAPPERSSHEPSAVDGGDNRGRADGAPAGHLPGGPGPGLDEAVRRAPDDGMAGGHAGDAHGDAFATVGASPAVGTGTEWAAVPVGADPASTAGHADGSGRDQGAASGPPAGPVTAWELLVEQEVNKRLLRDEAKRRYEALTAPPAGDLDGEYLDAADLGDLPKPDPLIGGVLARHCYMVLRGRDGTFKSFVALDWALCVATGKAWQDHAAERARVLYVAGEGAYGMDQRIQAWCTAWQRRPERGWFTLRKSSVNLFAGGPPLDHLVDRITRDGIGLVIIDTLRRASGGADGNTSDMGIVVDAIDRIKQATLHGSVLVIAHTDKTDTDSRGYSGIEDDADIIWHAKRDDESANGLELSNSKMKDGPDGAILALETVSVLDSLVVQARNGPEPVALLDTDARVMGAMRDMFASTGATARELLDALDIPQATLYRALGRLEGSGRLHLERRGQSRMVTLSAQEAATRRQELIMQHAEENGHSPHYRREKAGENPASGSMIDYHRPDLEILTDSHRLSPDSHDPLARTPHVVGVRSENDHENPGGASDPFDTGLSA